MNPRGPLAALGAAVLLVLTLGSCGNNCPFGALSRRAFPGQVAAGSASARHDLVAPTDVEVDVASATVPGQAGRVDAFLTRADCDRLFDGEYPPASGAAPRCPVIVGPVTPGAVSARQKVSAGTYRLHLYGYTSNTAPALYAVDVVFWGENCSGIVL
jgi:hypothetical protein